MFTKRRKQSPLAQDIRAARKSGIRTAIMVTLLVSGIVPTLCLVFSPGSGEIPFTDHLRKMGSVVLHTYPLTLAIAVITLSRRQKWLKWGKWFFAAGVVAGCATLGNLLGDMTGHGAIEPAAVFSQSSNPIFGVPSSGINYLVGFYHEYGFRTFVASILVGIYAGTTASRFLEHVPKGKSEALELARELVDSSRRAA